MTDTDRTEKETLAAEHALRLLEGEDALRARGMMASDAEFAAMVEAWEDRLAPLHEAIEPVEPGPELWQRIEAALERVRAKAISFLIAGSALLSISCT